MQAACGKNPEGHDWLQWSGKRMRLPEISARTRRFVFLAQREDANNLSDDIL